MFVGCEKALGGDHLDTLAVASNLAKLYLRQGKSNDAGVLLQRVFVGSKKTFGRHHLVTRTCWQPCGRVCDSRQT